MLKRSGRFVTSLIGPQTCGRLGVLCPGFRQAQTHSTLFLKTLTRQVEVLVDFFELSYAPSSNTPSKGLETGPIQKAHAVFWIRHPRCAMPIRFTPIQAASKHASGSSPSVHPNHPSKIDTPHYTTPPTATLAADAAVDFDCKGIKPLRSMFLKWLKWLKLGRCQAFLGR